MSNDDYLIYSLLEDAPLIKKLTKKKQELNELEVNTSKIEKLGIQETDIYKKLKQKRSNLEDEIWLERYKTGLHNGHDGIPARVMHKRETTALPDVPEKYLAKRLKLIKPALGGLGVLGALAAPDIASAAADVVIPGGVESMGVSDEQKMLDQQYKQRIRTRQESLNNLAN